MFKIAENILFRMFGEDYELAIAGTCVFPYDLGHQRPIETYPERVETFRTKLGLERAFMRMVKDGSILECGRTETVSYDGRTFVRRHVQSALPGISGTLCLTSYSVPYFGRPEIFIFDETLLLSSPKELSDVAMHLAERDKGIFLVGSQNTRDLLYAAERARMSDHTHVIGDIGPNDIVYLIHMGLQGHNIALPQEKVVVSNQPEGISLGRRAGMHTIAVADGYRPKGLLEAESPEFVVSSVNEVRYARPFGTYKYTHDGKTVEVEGGGIKMVYPVDQPGLMGAPSAREMMDASFGDGGLPIGHPKRESGGSSATHASIFG